MRNAELKGKVEPRYDAHPDIPHSEFRIPHSRQFGLVTM